MPQPPLKILHVSPTWEWAGINRSMKVLVDEQRRTFGHALFLHLPFEGEVAAAFRDDGLEVVTCGQKRRGRIPGEGLARRALSVLRFAARVRPDVIHCHSSFGVGDAYLACKLLRVPLVVHQRDAYVEKSARFGVSSADHVIAVTQFVKMSLPEKVRPRTTVVLCAVTEQPAAEHVAEGDARVTVGMAGLCQQRKGQDLLVRAAQIAFADPDVPPFRVRICGVQEQGSRGEWTNQLRDMIKGDAASADIFSLEAFRTDIHSFYPELDVMVVPSRVREGFGRVAAEAMSHGVATIVAGQGGLIEIVEDEKSGLTFVPDDAASLAEQLARVLTDDALRHRLAKAGLDRVREHFSAAVHAAGVERVYDTILSA